MEKEFIPYEQALALKELGFNEPCLGYYIELRNPQEGILTIDKCENNIDGVLAPLYQQAFRWFREKCNLNANVYKWQPDFSKSMGHLEWEGSVTHFTEKK